MTGRLGPGVYTYDIPNSNLATSLSGFNITAVIGLGKTWKLINNIEIIKSSTSENTAEANEVLYGTVVDNFIGNQLIPYTTYVLPITSSNEGYYKVDSSINGALKVVESDAKTGEINIASVTPWRETDPVIVGDYVINATDGKYLERPEILTGVKLVIPTLNNVDILKDNNNVNVDFDSLLSIESLGTLPGLNQYILNQDYIIQENSVDGYAQIVWLYNSYPEVGSSFYVSYKINKNDNDYQPKYMYSTAAIKNEYGPEYDNSIINSLTLAADLVIEGQTVFGGGVLCSQVKTNTLQGWKDAIDALDNKVFNTYILTGQQEEFGQQLQSYLKQKIKTLASEVYRKERTAFFVPYSTNMEIDEINAYRAALNDQRITLFANKTCTIELTDETTLETEYINLSSIYACANLSGIEGNPEYTFSEPMLRKQLTSRITLNDEQRFNPSEMFSLDNNGVSIFDMDLLTNITYIYVIGTTDTTNVMTETRAVRRETDLLRQNVRRNLNQYVGQKNRPLTASSATETTKSMLSNFVAIDEIGDFRDITSWFDTNEPRLLMQSFFYRPYLELRWIKVSIGTYI